MTYFWLSFADPDKPRGKQFLGGCVIEAESFPGAITEAHRLGCNPGGEVMGGMIEEQWERNIGEGKYPVGVLLAKSMIDELDQKLNSKLN